MPILLNGNFFMHSTQNNTIIRVSLIPTVENYYALHFFRLIPTLLHTDCSEYNGIWVRFFKNKKKNWGIFFPLALNSKISVLLPTKEIGTAIWNHKRKILAEMKILHILELNVEKAFGLMFIFLSSVLCVKVSSIF